MNFRPQICQKISLPCGCSLLFRPPILLAVFLLVLRCWQLLMPLLRSRPVQRLFPNARPFWVSCSTLFLVQYF
jgi:hypothetical protein